MKSNKSNPKDQDPEPHHEDQHEIEEKPKGKPKKLKTKGEFFTSVMAKRKTRTKATTKVVGMGASSAPLVQHVEKAENDGTSGVLGDEVSSRVPSALPPSRAAILAGVLDEVKARVPPAKQGGSKPDAARSDTTPVKKDRDGHVHGYGYGYGHRYQPRDHVYTTVNFCLKGHKRLECNWYFSNLVAKRTWVLELRDYRHDRRYFTNGVREHDTCHCEGVLVLLRKLARTMHTEMKKEADRLHGVVDMAVPSIAEIEQRLTALLRPILEQDRDGVRAADQGGKGKRDEGAKGNKEKIAQDKAMERRKEAKKAVETARMAKLLADKAEREAANKVRAEKAITKYTDAHKARNDEDMEARKTGRAVLPKGRDTARPLTKEEQKMLKGIRTAQKNEVAQQEQAEREENERQQQLAPEQGDIDESDGGLEEALMDAFDEAPESESATKANETKASKTSKKTEASAPTTESKRTPRPRVRRIIVDSSEDSDSVEEPKPSKKIKPASKPESKSTTKTKSMPEIDPAIMTSVDESRPKPTAEVTAKAKIVEKNKKTMPTSSKSNPASKQSEPAILDVEKVNCTTSSRPTTPHDSHEVEKQATLDPAPEAEANVEDGIRTQSAANPVQNAKPTSQELASPGERKRPVTNEEEPRHEAATTDEQGGEDAPSPSKKGKPTPPTSPGAVPVASTTSSSSSKKRKMDSSEDEDEGEVARSPGGTKRFKRMQVSEQVVFVQEDDVLEGAVGIEIAQAESVYGEELDEDADAKSDMSKDSLFDGSVHSQEADDDAEADADADAKSDVSKDSLFDESVHSQEGDVAVDADADADAKSDVSKYSLFDE